jgi:hypothetical protein
MIKRLLFCTSAGIQFSSGVSESTRRHPPLYTIGSNIHELYFKSQHNASFALLKTKWFPKSWKKMPNQLPKLI